MKNNKDRQNPNPRAPNIAPAGRLLKDTILKTSVVTDSGSKLLPTEKYEIHFEECSYLTIRQNNITMPIPTDNHKISK